MGRAAQNVDAMLPTFRKSVEDFLSNGRFEESNLIVDGPGIGCTTHIALMSLLGFERICNLKEAHFFSSSGYAPLFMYANQIGEMTWPVHQLNGWNRGNQKRHQIIPILTSVKFLYRFLVTQRPLFSNILLADALGATVSENFLNRTVKDLPHNFHFWTYNEDEKKFCDIHAHSAFSHWTTGEVMRSLVAVPRLYEPFVKDNKTYSDALLGLNIRSLFQDLRKRSSNTLFWHMRNSGSKDGTIFVKGHQSSNGKLRILQDFAFFILGISNPEFDRSMELAFSEIQPLIESTNY